MPATLRIGDPPDGVSPRHRPGWRLAILLLCALHAVQALRWFPTWSAVVDDRPILQVDHALHLYHGSLGAHFLRAHGTNWGYDPFFMAGYPKTPFHDPSALWSDLCQALAGGYSPRAYKLGLLLSIVTTPWLLVAAANMLGIARGATLAGLILALVYYWTEFPRDLVDSGLSSFVWSTGWMALVIAAVARWHEAPSWRTWSTLTFGTAFAVMLHPTVPVVLALPLVVFYGVVAFRHGWRWHVRLWLAVGLVAAINAFWLVPLVHLFPQKAPQFHFLVAPANAPGFVLTYYRQHPLPLVIATLGIVGWMGWLRGPHAGRRLFAGLMLVLAGLTFFGSLKPAVLPQASDLRLLLAAVGEFTRSLEPLRFQVPLHLLLALAAGEGVTTLVQRVGRWQAKAARLGMILVVVAVVAPLVAGTAPGQAMVRRLVFRLWHPRPFAIGFTPEMEQVVAWLKENTTREHRILIEDQLRLLEPTVAESLHWTPLLPLRVDREFIGGQYQCTPLLHHVASFGDYQLGQRPIESYTPAELRAFVDRYNIGWILCWSPASRMSFDALADVERVAVLPRPATPGLKPHESRYVAYRVKRPVGYVAEGTGRVVASAPNRLEFADLVPVNGRVVVRYHWLATMRAEPEVPLSRVENGPDPVGMLAIETDRPLPRVIITNAYRWPR